MRLGLFSARTCAWLEREAGFQFVTTAALDVMAPHIVQTDYLVRGYVSGFNPRFAPATHPLAGLESTRLSSG